MKVTQIMASIISFSNREKEWEEVFMLLRCLLEQLSQVKICLRQHCQDQ